MNRLVNNLKSVLNRLSSISLPDKYRGGSIEKAIDYLRQVKNDYKQVFIDTKNDCRDRPLRATSVASMLSFVVYCMATNPDENDLRQQLIDSQNNLSTVPNSIMNRSSCDHVLELTQLRNEKLLNYQSLGLFSVLYISDYPKNCCLFVNNCQYLRPKLSSYLFDRIIDIGFIRRFRLLDIKMIDYDINQNEWEVIKS